MKVGPPFGCAAAVVPGWMGGGLGSRPMTRKIGERQRGDPVARQTLAQRDERPAEAAAPGHAGGALPLHTRGGPLGAGLQESLVHDRGHEIFVDVHGVIVAAFAP
jgi:hypothetical protein